MIAELTKAISDKLKHDGLDTREIAFKDLIDKTINLTKPAVNVTVNTSTFEKVTIYTYKARMTVSLILIFQQLKGGIEGEYLRKEGIYKIIEAVVLSLALEKLGLDLENPLIPEGFRNITSYEYARAGIQLYELRFWCSMIFSKDPDYDEGTLSSILAKYYMEPRGYTGMQGITGPEAMDLIGFTGVQTL
jgi:hypothetical protein